jgi:hypothetical protein
MNDSRGGQQWQWRRHNPGGGSCHTLEGQHPGGPLAREGVSPLPASVLSASRRKSSWAATLQRGEGGAMHMVNWLNL